MRTTTITMIVIALGIQCSLCRSATISSTSTLNQSFFNGLHYSTSFKSAALGINERQFPFASVYSGVNSVSVQGQRAL